MNDLRDPREFRRAYEDHAASMLATANRVLRDPAAAEDVVQDVFTALWRKPEAFDPSRGTLSSYLTMMARSRAVDRWRTRTVREAAVDRSARERAAETSMGEDAAAHVIRRDRSRLVLGALDRLPGDQREAVLLAFGKGLSAREIAQASGIPLGTAKSRVRLGLQKARSELASAA